MKLGVIATQTEPEAVSNGLRLTTSSVCWTKQGIHAR
jgi:hypothetical protein